MIWFKQQYLWMIVSAAAVCVSCQELTSTLRDGSHACRGEEVIFTCTVRGSQTLTDLILAWSSTEYIGQGDPLRFASQEAQGTKRTSTINGNVTAILISNTNRNGESILVSELRIVADQASTVTCTSETTTSEDSAMFNISGVPEPPLNVGATAVLQLSENDCEILVKWDPPPNSVDIINYVIYVPALNVAVTTSSFISSLLLRDCPERFSVTVAAVNRFGCIGINSSEVNVTLQMQPTSEPFTSELSSESSQLSAGAVVGITIGVLAVIIIIILIIINRKRVGRFFVPKDDHEQRQRLLPMSEESQETHESHLLLTQSGIKESLLNLYSVLSTHSVRKEEISDSVFDSFMSAIGALRAELNKAKAIDIRDELKNSLEELKKEADENVRRALDHLMEILNFPDMPNVDDGFKSNVEELRDEKKSPSIKVALDSMIEKVDWPTPHEIQKILLRLCDALFKKFLKLSPKQEEVVNMFEIPVQSLKEVERLLSAEFTKGLEREGEDVKVKMVVTHVHKMPKGTEEGEFLVVDVGVHHLRVLHITIIKGSIRKKDPNEFYIGPNNTKSSYENLFDFVVDSIAKFIKDRNIRRQLPIGFTFPFPMKHESLTHGRLIRWTRDFKGTGVEGKDVVQLLKDAASRREDNMQINVVALINDTIGILLSVGNEVPDCHIGLALGDGANACYMEEVDAIPKFRGDQRHTKVIVNTEWGAFGDDGKLEQWRNEYDRKLDEKSSNPGQQIFDKLIADKYQGRIVYLILEDLISKGELFGGQSSPRFDDFESFNTQRLSTMEGWDMKECKKLFKDRFDIEASDKDCEVIRRVCEAVSTRAARLAAAGIVALVKKINKMDGCTVAVDGSTYKRDRFPDRLRDALDELAPRNNIKMKLTEDGSSIGAAFAAAMNYDGSPPSSTPSSPTRGESVGQDLKLVNTGDQGRHPPQAQAGDIELPQIIIKNP